MNIFATFARRTVHFGLKLAAPFLGYRPPRQVGYDEAANELKDAGRARVLLVTGKHVRAHGLCEPLLAALDRAGIEAEIFDDVPANPTTSCVEAALALYRKANCDCVAAVGGGSPMDCAKGVCARIASPKKPLSEMKGALKVRGKAPLLLAVPTTAGSGSEATAAAVFTDENTHEKFAVFSFKLVPKLCILDPALTLSLPPEATADTGLDALTHAVEAYVGRATTKGSRKRAETAARRIFRSLPAAYADGNKDARTDMLLAAEEAGEAFTVSYVGYVHALAHALGGAYGLPHGRLCAVLLLPVLRAYGKKARKKLARLAEVCGFCGGTPRKEAAKRFLMETERLLRTLCIPERLPIEEADIPILARRATREAFPYPVPKLLGVRELEKILRAVKAEADKDETHHSTFG